MTREQFIELVKGEQDALRHYLLALCCGDMATADDIAQETLVKAYLSILSYSGKGKLRSWIFAIAHNTFLNHQKAIKTHETLEEAKTVAGIIVGAGSMVLLPSIKATVIEKMASTLAATSMIEIDNPIATVNMGIALIAGITAFLIVRNVQGIRGILDRDTSTVKL